MQELLLVNPRARTKRRSTKAASPAQKRARAAFAAMARSRSKNPAKRRKHAVKHRRVHHAVATTHHTVKRHHARRRNPASRSGSILKKPMAIITPALIGALGATAVNTILGKLPIPATLMTGNARYLTQAAAAIGLAAIAGKMGMKGAMAHQMAEGSLTVTLHQAITDIAGGMGMNLSGMGYYLPGIGPRAVPSASGNPAALAGMGKYMTGPGAPVAYPANVSVMQKKQLRGFNF